MVNFIFILSFCAFIMTCWAAFILFVGLRKMGFLGETSFSMDSNEPGVSIIAAACNEEESVEKAVRALMKLRYENFNVIFVNDRSTDGTGNILRKLQGEFSNLQVITIDSIPEGWLGKTNALQRGAEIADGDYILFTDADVLLEPETLGRAMAHVKVHELDHLSLFFKNIAEGALLNALCIDAGGGLLFLFRPWLAKVTQSRYFMGVGAFNLVKKSAYDAIGGHGSVKMHPIDDIMLGKKLKQNGCRQDCLLAPDFVSVRWYDSVKAMIDGLMKNAFALYNFRVSLVLLASILIMAGAIAPLWILLLSQGKAQILAALTIFVRLWTFSKGAKIVGGKQGLMFFALITPYINLYILLKATFLTMRNKGIYWRGTFYQLDQLRGNEPIL